ncbi:glycosyltransferase family 9 protein [Desulfomonile tiedjei]|uniref:ADP-heptose:LPS heptosyltransferase n=1 Tax=Desulfomonile tiedjei (strain ATCC 49306 / DSM 6799 / DCB-1) TaxID=706587 RepID=I4C882_DESTA|nr:glycosyltransferase family 9 protein [Desulfomonile tiedjei]AFM25773.1 ADP-heptose:LPS heptosyltransferase [Desulfomonile tiedjei DSM 6799]
MDISGKRILIVKQSSLGDVVHALPLVHALKRCHPDCHIGWIVQKGFAPLLEPDRCVDDIIPISIPSTSDPQAKKGIYGEAARATFRTLKELRRKFRAAPYDIVLDLHASLRSGFLGLTNPGGVRIGFADAKEFNTFFQHHRLVTRADEPHAVDKNLVFARFLNCLPEPEDFRIEINQGARGSVEKFLRESGIRTDRQIIYANPSARWTTKFWTVPAWAEFADLVAEQTSAAVIFAGSPEDRPYIDQIMALTRSVPVVAAGKLSLAESVALLSLSDVYVGVDSGPMHIAAFTGTPVVALFGPTEPEKVGPYGSGHLVVRREDLTCLGCRKRTCDNRECLQSLSAWTVFDALLELLGRTAEQKTVRRIP